MSKIDELIAQYCPDGVEYKELGDVCNFRNGFAFKSSKFKVKGQPILRIGNIQNRKVDINNLIYFDINDYSENLKPFEVLNGDVLVAMSGATTGKIGRLNSKEVFYLNQRVGKFEPNKELLKNNFLYHYLLTKSEELYVLAGGGAQPNLSSTALMRRITIPIPPLPVQEAIVEILDKFTALEAELEAELEARTRQYEYYRNELLSFDGKDIEWKALGEVAFYSKSRIAAIEICSNTYVGVDNLIQNKKGKTYSTYVPTSGNLTKFIPNDILIGNIRPYLKKIWKSNITGGTNGDVLVIRINDDFKTKLNPDYLYYLLSSDSFFEFNMQYAKGAKMPRGDKESILKYSLPIPPLEEQNRIVAILDKFDALVNDISTGLPAEIKARREQYEYYRGKLLSFEPKSA